MESDFKSAKAALELTGECSASALFRVTFLLWNCLSKSSVQPGQPPFAKPSNLGLAATGARGPQNQGGSRPTRVKFQRWRSALGRGMRKDRGTGTGSRGDWRVVGRLRKGDAVQVSWGIRTRGHPGSVRRSAKPG